jgi:hypothetical protein
MDDDLKDRIRSLLVAFSKEMAEFVQTLENLDADLQKIIKALDKPASGAKGE